MKSSEAVYERSSAVTWEEFQKTKRRNLEQLEKTVALTKELRGHWFDLDIEDAVRAWNRIPFTRTGQSCSGTPNDHGPKDKWGTRFRNYQRVPPNGWLSANSYAADPRFEAFDKELRQIEGISFRADELRDDEGYAGLHLHIIEFWVPEDLVRENKDLLYLNRCWDRVEDFAKEFYDRHCD